LGLIVGAQTEPRTVARTQWVLPAAVLAGLVLVLYAPVLKLLLLQWWEDPDYSHGFLVPLFAGYLLWRDRDRWPAVPLEPSDLGLATMVGAVGLLLAGSLGAELFVSRLSLILLLGGMVLYLAGWKMLRAVAFPLGFLLFMIPLPEIIYNQITFPLQLVASRFALFCLDVVHVPALREGNLLKLPGYTLEVAEACSGIRSLMTLVTLVMAFNYCIEKRWWRRILLVALVVPVAILSNGLRIVATGVLTYCFGVQWAEGFLHVFSGWVVFVVALFLMVLIHQLLSRLGRAKG
jgi:exosortase